MLNNEPGATFDAQSDDSLVWGGFVSTGAGAVPTFNNLAGAAVVKSGGTGSTGTQMGVVFNNAGVVDVQSGTLALGADDVIATATSSGSFQGAPGTTLEFLTSQDFAAASSIDADTVVFSSGYDNSNDAGTYSASTATLIEGSAAVTFTGAVSSVGASLDISGVADFGPAVPATLSTGECTIVNSYLAGTDSLIVTGMLTLDGGILQTSGTTDAEGGITIEDYSSTGAVLEYGTLNNYGTASWTGGAIVANNGAVLNNEPGATFDAQSDDSLVWGGFVSTGAGAVPTFNNLAGAAVVKSGGTGSTGTQMGVVFNNAGVVDVQSGTLQLGGSFPGGQPVTNSGTVTVGAGTTLAALSDYDQMAGSTTLDGDTFSGTNLYVEGGALAGSGVVNANVTNAGQVIPGGTGAAGLLTINGTYTQTASGSLDVDLGGTTAESQYDQLAVSGTASLGGTLDVALIHSFQPVVGDTFRVVSFGSSSGNFASYQGPSLASGLFLDTVLGASSLTLDVDQVAIGGAPAVPLPGIPIALTSEVTGPSSGNSFTFTWNVTQNSSPFGSGSGTTFTFTPNAIATYLVTLTVTDVIGGKGTATLQIVVAPSIFVLDPTAGGALSLSGNASISIAGGVYVDSSSSSALSASGNATVRASVIDVHGGVLKSGNASFSPAPVTGAATVADPLALLPEPSTTGLTNHGSESMSGNSSATIQPGIYSAISASGNANLTLSCGTYIIEGGGFTVSGNANVSGSGVLIVNAGTDYPSSGGSYGSISLSGNGSYHLTPPTTGTYAGIVIFQARDNSKAMTVSGNASGMTGTIYAPAAQLSESGNAQLNAALIVDTLTISGNGVANIVTLSSPTGTVAYTPAQIRAAYGISSLSLDGTGQTIAIVDAYDDPEIYAALDAFDSQFGLTDSGPTLYDQYGPSSSFLTVLNQYGQATSLPSTDPNGAGTDNWEVEEALDVEWAHAIAPGAQIILVEANSQSLSDLMAGVATAASRPGVSVVSMSWGFAEGQAVFASDEATYDGVFNVPGVAFVASTGDYGAADPEYPAFSPNVVAVGGTSLTLNADDSYNSETGWGYQSSSAGAFIASGGGLSLYEPEPAYQLSVQSTGSRTTPDVSLVADPATGAWIADPYNLDPSNPFEIVGGTSLSAPAWAGLLALVNQGRAAAGESTLNSTSPTETQQALYACPRAILT